MGYKFGQKSNKIMIEIEDKQYPVALNNETAKALEKFGADATAISKKNPEEFDFEEMEDLIVDFIETILGVDATAEIIENMDDEYKNAFEFMALAQYITDEVKEQADKINKANAQAPKAMPRKRR